VIGAPSKSVKCVFRAPPPGECACERILLDDRNSRAFAHLPHRKEHRWRRRMACPTQQSLRFVGDGREDARESTLAGIARPAKTTVFGPTDCCRSLESKSVTSDIRTPPPGECACERILLDARISRAFAHLPHRKGRRWRRRKSIKSVKSVVRHLSLFVFGDISIMNKQKTTGGLFYGNGH